MPRPVLLSLAAFLVLAPAAVLKAQNSEPAQARDSSQPTASNSASAEAASGKKVWTNDDVSGLRADPAISTFRSTAAPTRAAKALALGPKKSAAWYRDQISKLQAKIPPIDAQMAALQAAIDGKPTGDARKSTRPYSVRVDDWSGERDQLGKKRDEITAQISDLQDEARRNGVPANALP
jgi:hypothetical protein